MTPTAKQPYLNGICFITGERTPSKSLIDIVIEVIQSGITWIQLRDKSGSRQRIFKMARVLKSYTRANDVTLIINDHADIVNAVDAEGVHLGQEDLPLKEARKIIGEKIIGISTHSVEQALEAQRNGADYIGFGPLFYTETKDAGEPKGFESLKELKRHVSLPVVAIGGIKEEHVPHILRAGADAVAVSSGIANAPDIAEAAHRYVRLIQDTLGGERGENDNG